MFIITSPELHEDFDSTIEVQDIVEDKSGVALFDDVLESNQETVDTFSTTGSHKVLSVQHLSHFLIYQNVL